MATLGLNAGYISLNPRRDPSLFLGPRKESINEIIDQMIITIDTSRVLKKVILGPFGIGKTQFIKYAMNKLKDVAFPIYVETPPCHRRTRFIDIHSVIMRRIGRKFILDHLKKTIDLANDKGITIYELLQIEERDIGYTIENNIGINDIMLWRYISGIKILAADVRILEVLTNQIYEDDSVWILNTIASIVNIFYDKQLVIFMDELENTANIFGDSRVMFTEAIRGLVDESSYVGMVFVVSARSIEGIPIALTDEPVRRRIGISNYEPFKEYNKEELDGLIRELILYRRNKEVNIKDILKNLSKEEYKNTSTDIYPFTNKAIDKIIEVVYKLRKEGLIDGIRPREALSIMDDSVAYALQNKLHLINEENVKIVSERYLKDIEKVVIP